MTKTKLSIIIPVYNELDNVATLLDEINCVMSKTDYVFEVIFVDDASTDGTRERLNGLSKSHDKLKVINHKKNYGQSAGLVSGR